jgi:hypothetical protein
MSAFTNKKAGAGTCLAPGAALKRFLCPRGLKKIPARPMIVHQKEQVIELIVAPTCFAAGLRFLEVRNRGRTPGGRRAYAQDRRGAFIDHIFKALTILGTCKPREHHLILGHRRCRPNSAYSGAAGEKNYGRFFTVASHSTNIGCCFRPSDVWRYRLEVELCSGQPKIFYKFSILITGRMANSAFSHIFNNIFSSRDLVISRGTIRPPSCQDVEFEKCCDSRYL